MALNYTVYQYDSKRKAVVMTDMDGKELVIDCIIIIPDYIQRWIRNSWLHI